VTASVFASSDSFSEYSDSSLLEESPEYPDDDRESSESDSAGFDDPSVSLTSPDETTEQESSSEDDTARSNAAICASMSFRDFFGI